MDVPAQNRPRRRLSWWLVPLLVVSLIGVAAFLALRLWSPPLDDGANSDSLLIRNAAFYGSNSRLKDVRTQLGEERFWRSIKRDLANRPADWEDALHTWMQYPNHSRLVQGIIDKLLPQLESRWFPREERLQTATMILSQNFQHTAVPALPELIQLAESSRGLYAQQGIETLERLREGAAAALPRLLRRLENANGYVGPTLATAIGNIDQQGASSAQRMVALLPTAPKATRVALLPVIGAFARYHAGLETNLWPALQEGRDLASAAIQGLSLARQLTPERLEPFRKGFQSEDTNISWLSLNLVAASGPMAAGFVPELRQVALRQSPDQATAMGALRTVLSAEARQLADLRFAAAEALIASDNSGAAWEALVVLPSIDPNGEQTRLLATKALAHPVANIRAKGADVLGRLGPAARPALPQLRALRNDEWKMVRDAVELALPKIGE